MKKYFGLLAILFLINTSVCAKTVYPKPAVITFYQKDCEACEQLNLVKQEAMEEYDGKVDFAKININVEDCDFDALMKRYNITSAPTTLFLNSQYGITKKTTGYIPKKLYIKQIEAIVAE